MLRGVGSFFAGKSTISEWETTETPGILDDALPREVGIHKVQQYVQQNTEPESPDTVIDNSSASAKRQLGSLKAQQPPKPQPLRRPGPTPISNPTSSDKPTTADLSMSSFGRTHPQDPRVHQLFSKATNVIREAIDVEDVLFLEASIRSFGGLTESSTHAIKSADGSKSSSSSSDETEHPERCVNSSCSQRKAKPRCRIFGFSSSSVASIDGDPPCRAFSSVSEGFLAKLLRRYPKGKIFNFDAEGNVQSSDDSSDETILGLSAMNLENGSIGSPEQPQKTESSRKRRREQLSRLKEAKQIMSIFPDARSVCIVPLWDMQKHRWYAGGFVSTTTPGRTFTIEHELGYLRAFGIVIMSEVDRMKAQLIERSKTDLLSSLSHELRSPLHGIILGAELLSDTSLDAFQEEMLASIETCGRTLLETMDHLLDLSRINNFIGSSPSRQNTKGAIATNDTTALNDRSVANRGQRPGIEAGMMSIASDVELDILAEEVVESVCAGFSYQQLSIAHHVNQQSSEHAEVPDLVRRLDSLQAIEDAAFKPQSRGDLLSLLGEVTVTFDVSPAVSWTFHTQSGAIRRIIMNLLGNSLKFTSKGTVNVKVLQVLQDKRKPSASTRVKIIVTDTGRGISDNYLQNHIFSPFCQEDSISTGLGLGLSLVNQIVAKLGGSIQVLSKLGHGTKVTVVLPLQEAAPTSPTGNPYSAGFDEFRSLSDQLKGLRVRIFGPSTEHNAHADGDPDWLKGTRSEGALLANFCAQWLQMHVVEHSVSEHILADMVVTTEAFLEDLLSEQSHGGMSTPVIVVCRNSLVARQLAVSARFKNSDTVIEFVSQPIGPRKLAKVLLLSLRRWIKLQAATMSIPTPSSLGTVEATPGDLAPDDGIRLTPEVEYFCKPFINNETFAVPAAEDGTSNDSQLEEDVQKTARLDFLAREVDTKSDNLSERPKKDCVSSLAPAAPTKMT
ncbi:Histidine kinase 5-like protein 2 [Colletotrichum truncatum]|uniref:Histidine kinase 5-like protein 2 n=1 Tax=Colletotrichum truncatum TaxID=5467 RepID=A0ACC3YE19_COLTU|nr:Histidine kinase 5-like protein 2 [Colletotrichum truncatum]KAF6790200.1 Histidine kinase 5-like protein 2 [Colletotrichum truncatum]